MKPNKNITRKPVARMRGSLKRCVRLAHECPLYGESFEKFQNHTAIISLSDALKKAGYPYLSKAVRGGVGWSRRMRAFTKKYQFDYEEEHASGPGWSWNRTA